MTALAPPQPAAPSLATEPRLRMDAAAARSLLWALLAITLLQAAYIGLIVTTYPDQLFRLPGVLVSLSVCLAATYPLLKRNGLLAIKTICYGGLIYIAVSAATGGGLAAPITIALPMLVLIPGTLLGRRQARRFALLTLLLCVLLLIAELTGLITHPPPLPPLLLFLLIIVVLSSAWILINFALQAQRQRLNEIILLHGELAASHATAESLLRDFTTLADNLPVMVVRLDTALRMLYVNAAFQKISRTRPEPGLHRTLDEFCTPEQMAILRPAVAAAQLGERAVFLLPGHTASYLFEVTMIAEFDSDSRCVGYLMLLNDVTERERLQVELRHAATRDALTGLANRMSLDSILEQALALANREQTLLALLAIDLDGFKPINDTWGHAAGDALLQHVAEQMRHTVRSADTVGRVGGDEFVVLLTGLTDASVIGPLAEKILTAIKTPTRYEGHELQVGASIGIAVFPRHGLRPGDLHEAADAAMYAAKRGGKNRYCIAPTERPSVAP